ncbi:MAG: hypothetical protein R3D29_11250 [Nitratireductor sp.]
MAEMTISPFAWGDEQLVNTTTADQQAYPQIAVLGNGNYVVVYSDSSDSGGTNGIDVRGSYSVQPENRLARNSSYPNPRRKSG